MDALFAQPTQPASGGRDSSCNALAIWTAFTVLTPRPCPVFNAETNKVFL